MVRGSGSGRSLSSLPGVSRRPAARLPYDPGMDRPKGFADNRYIGDKRSQVVYDLDDEATRAEAIDDLMAAESFLAFAPDTLPEARNRRYRLWKGSRAAG